MKTDTHKTDQPRTLLDELHDLLQQQVDMLREGKLNRLEAITEQTNAVVARIAENPVPLKSQWKNQGKKVTDVYKKIELMIETEKESVNSQLRKVADGKKTIRLYQHKQ